MKRKIVYLWMILSIFLLSGLYSNNLKAGEVQSSETTDTTKTSVELYNYPERIYYLEGIDDTIDLLGTAISYLDGNGDSGYEWYNVDDPDPLISYEYDEGSIQLNEDGTFCRTDSTVPIRIKYDGKEIGIHYIQILSREDYQIEVNMCNLRTPQFATDERLDCSSQESYITVSLYCVGQEECIFSVDSYQTERWEKMKLAIQCIWPDETVGLDQEMQLGEAQLTVLFNGEEIGSTTVNVVESIDSITKKTFDQPGIQEGYQIETVNPYNMTLDKDYYKLVIEDEGYYWFYFRNNSDYRIYGEILSSDLTQQKKYINISSYYTGDYAEDSEGYCRDDSLCYLEAGTYYLVVESYRSEDDAPLDFYYQKMSKITKAELVGQNEIQTDFMVGTRYDELKFPALRWMITMEGGRQETQYGIGNYYANVNECKPSYGVCWSLTDSSSGTEEENFSEIGQVSISAYYCYDNEIIGSAEFPINICSFPDMIQNYKVFLCDVKTEYVKQLEKQLDTSGISVTYRRKDQLYNEEVTPQDEAWSDCGFSIHCIWENTQKDSGDRLEETGKATVQIKLGDNKILGSYDISVDNTIEDVLSGTFKEQKVTYDVTRKKGKSGYYYKMTVPEDGNYDLYIKDYRTEREWEDAPAMIFYDENGEKIEEVPLYSCYMEGERDGSTLAVDEDGFLQKIYLSQGEYFVEFKELPLGLNRQLTFRYEKEKQLKNYELFLPIMSSPKSLIFQAFL